MKIIFTTLVFLCSFISMKAQTDVTAQFEKEYTEGIECHDLEILMEKCLQILEFNPLMFPEVRGFFPIRQNNEFHLIFWEHTFEPRVFMTLICPKDSLQGKIDTVKREFNPFEAGVFEMLEQAKADHKKDTQYRHIPNTKEILIPIVTAYGNKVLCMTRAREPNMFILGNDVEYEFDSEYRIVSKKTIHTKATFECIEPAEEMRNLTTLVGIHPHLGDQVHGISSTDIASLQYYAKQYPWGAYVIVEDTMSYTMEPPSFHLFKWPAENAAELRDQINKRTKILTILE